MSSIYLLYYWEPGDYRTDPHLMKAFKYKDKANEYIAGLIDAYYNAHDWSHMSKEEINEYIEHERSCYSIKEFGLE